MNDSIYLDNNATTKPLPEVVEAVNEALLKHWKNASSPYEASASSRALLNEAREAVAHFVGAAPSAVIFTSGGTEANNLAIHAALRRAVSLESRVISSRLEHVSVLEVLDSYELGYVKVEYAPISQSGLVDFSWLESTVKKGRSVIILQWVNNETGVIQPIQQVAELCRQNDSILIVDATQALGKLPIDLGSVPIDYLTFTGHKMHAPMGVGVLISPHVTQPLLRGGAQENGRRAGTENLPGIAGLGAAMNARAGKVPVVVESVSAMRASFEDLIMDRFPRVSINGSVNHRVCNTSNLMFPDIDGQALLARINTAGVECSQSSACTNARPEPSHVLTAMGLTDEQAYSSIRFSFSELNTMAEAHEAAARVCNVYETLLNKMIELGC